MKAVVITGTRAAGKSTLARALAESSPKFHKVSAVTTRQARPDDIPGEYEYVEKTGEFPADGDLLVRASYGGNSYGIRSKAVSQCIDSGKVPVLVVAPDVLSSILSAPGIESREVVSIFLDAEDVVLDERIRNRDEREPHDTDWGQRELDRQHAPDALFRFNGACSTDALVHAVNVAWDLNGRCGVLPGRAIQAYCAVDGLLYGHHEDHVKSASYDLRLGDQYYQGDGVKELSRQDIFVEIPPYDFAIVTMREECRIPNDVVARFDLTVRLFQKGIILSNSTQVDPGFEGRLFCLLFNTSSQAVRLKRGTHISTLEFSKVVEPTTPYRGKYKDAGLDAYLQEHVVKGGIHDLKRTVDDLKAHTKFQQEMVWATLALIVSVFALFMSLQ